MWQLWQNLHCSLRSLHKNPGFTAVAILSLALGIGANVAIFALINALMLRDLPVPHPERLVELFLVRNGAKLPSRIRCFVNSTGASAFFLRVHRLERPLVVQRQSERSARTKPRFLGYRQFLPGTCEKLPVCRPFVGTELEPNLGDTVRSFREEQASVLHHISRILVIAYCANLNAESDRQWFIDALLLSRLSKLSYS